jgi:hypothetical protein
MDLDDVWRTIDAERSSLADLLEDLSPTEWRTARSAKPGRWVTSPSTSPRRTWGSAPPW